MGRMRHNQNNDFDSWAHSRTRCAHLVFSDVFKSSGDDLQERGGLPGGPIMRIYKSMEDLEEILRADATKPRSNWTAAEREAAGEVLSEMRSVVKTIVKTTAVTLCLSAVGVANNRLEAVHFHNALRSC